MSDVDLDPLTEPGDRAYVASIDDPELRQTIVSSLLRHRVSERLAAGDAAPDVSLTRLEPRGTVALRELVRERPVLLVFGSYT
jgi:hypothetical protein